MLTRCHCCHCEGMILRVTSSHCAEGKDHFLAKWFYRCSRIGDSSHPAHPPPRISRRYQGAVCACKADSRQLPARSPSAYPHSRPPFRTSASSRGKGCFPLGNKTHLSTPKRHGGLGGCHQLRARRQTRFPLFLDAYLQSYFIRQTPSESKIATALCFFPRLGEGKWSAVSWELRGNRVFVSCRLGLSPERQTGGKLSLGYPFEAVL